MLILVINSHHISYIHIVSSSVIISVSGAVMPAATISTIPTMLRLNQESNTNAVTKDISGIAYGILEIVVQLSHIIGKQLLHLLYYSNLSHNYR